MAQMTRLSSADPVIAVQGADGFVVRFGDKLTDEANRAALALARALEGGAVPGVAEVSTALASVYLRCEPGEVDAAEEALRAEIAGGGYLDADAGGPTVRWTIPALPHAEGLAEAAQAAGLETKAAAAELFATTLRVMSIGFAPGQPYLGELPPAFDLPRRSELTRVDAGDLAIAIRQAVLFTNGSPTGWHPVAKTAFRCFRPGAEEAFPLSPGDEVRFALVGRAEFEGLKDDPAGGAKREVLS